jgi:Ca2+-binding EF-hand superfamily protein
MENPEFILKIFDSADNGTKDDILEWEEFFVAMKMVMSKSLKDKLDLFFSVVDSDGNGNFSFEEIKEICEMSLMKSDSDDAKFVDQQTEFYAKYIFKILGYDLNDEIPTEVFKKAIS